jgi:multidrug efflux pump subunit AcrB
MTLGWLAFAVGILVDDATVTIENNPSDESAELSRLRGVPMVKSENGAHAHSTLLPVIVILQLASQS